MIFGTHPYAKPWERVVDLWISEFSMTTGCLDDLTIVRLFSAVGATSHACMPLYVGDKKKENHDAAAPFFHKVHAASPKPKFFKSDGATPISPNFRPTMGFDSSSSDAYLFHVFAKELTLHSGTTISLRVRSTGTTWDKWGGIFGIIGPTGDTITSCVRGTHARMAPRTVQYVPWWRSVLVARASHPLCSVFCSGRPTDGRAGSSSSRA